MRSRADRRIARSAVGAALCALAAWSLVPGAGSAAGRSADADCRQVKLISVRGTGDNLNLYGWIGSKVSGALVKRARAAGASYGVLGVDYPARGWPDAPLYPFSKNRGRDELRRVIKAQAAQCPSQKLALLGYSQGAHVVGDVLSRGPLGGLTPVELSRVRAVALIADPRFNSREPFAAGSFRLGRNGALGARSPGDLDGVKGRIRSWCRKDDFWCQGPGSFAEHRQEEYWADYGEEIVGLLAARLGWQKASATLKPPVSGLFLEGHLLGLKGGLTPAQVVARWGQPSARRAGTFSYRLIYPGITVGFTKITPSASPALSDIQVTGTGFRTPRNVRIGTPLATAESAYPDAVRDGGKLYFENGPGLYEGAVIRNGRVAILFYFLDF